MTRQPPASASRTLADAERGHILEVVKQTGWQIGGRDGAAERLGLPRTTLVYKMRKLGIEARRSHRVHLVQPETPLVARAAVGGSGTGRFEPVVAF